MDHRGAVVLGGMPIDEQLSSFKSAGTRHLMGFSPGQMRGRRVDFSCPRAVPPKAASVLAPINDGALRVALTRHH